MPDCAETSPAETKDQEKTREVKFHIKKESPSEAESFRRASSKATSRGALNCSESLLLQPSRGILEACAKSFGGYVERRRAVRFQLTAPVILEWTEPSGTKRENLGRTHDISILGAFVVCPFPLPTDTAVSLEVHLPPVERNTFQQLRLTGRGKVTRTIWNGEGSGFATSLRFVFEEGNLAPEGH
jgi:hypothetical protein